MSSRMSRISSFSADSLKVQVTNGSDASSPLGDGISSSLKSSLQAFSVEVDTEGSTAAAISARGMSAFGWVVSPQQLVAAEPLAILSRHLSAIAGAAFLYGAGGGS